MVDVCRDKKRDLPLSVLGSATVTLTVHVSQHTSSLPPPHILRRRDVVFSMNCTDTWPLPPPPPVLFSALPPPPPPSSPASAARPCCGSDWWA